MTDRERVKITLKVAARKHQPSTKSEAIRMWSEVLDERNYQHATELDRISTVKAGFRRLFSETWNELRRDG